MLTSVPMKIPTKHNPESQLGFTLIELIIVMGIIGVLSTIGVAALNVYKVKAYNGVAVTDLRHIVLSQEASYVDNETYGSCSGTLACEGEFEDFVGTRDDNGNPVLSIFEVVGTDIKFTVESRHIKGNMTYAFDNSVGSLEQRE